ncbi:RtcB-like RNA ligase [Rhodococcus phage Grayson]|nr:RtcB-like RNA ligase [Rhodococcus phage Grayson]
MTFPVELPGAKADTKLWLPAEDIEHEAYEQLLNVSRLPWIDRLAVMPDCHFGKGATVGSVLGMKNAISPSAVGVDLGCGMSAIKTSLNARDLPEDLTALRTKIEEQIPVGRNSHKSEVKYARLDVSHGDITKLWNDAKLLNADVKNRLDYAANQVGTLGGGNHFIEVCLDESEDVWIMLHSGSRNIGKVIAESHIEVAKLQEHNFDLPDRDLAVLLQDTDEFNSYVFDVYWAQRYARINREVMLGIFKKILQHLFVDIKFDEAISCHHNYIDTEVIDDVELIVTRKGAIRAGAGQLGLIPGSMGTGSYVVRGLGNADSMFSASHGAGRKMSRAKAKKTFTVDDLAVQTEGVNCRKDQGVVDEIPGAYKDINEVIKRQESLVEPLHFLRQILCVKG